MRLTPRSQWPKGTSPVNAWHLDKHLKPLFMAGDEIAKQYPAASKELTLPTEVINRLVEVAATTDSIYTATAALDHLFDALESLEVTIDALVRRHEGASPKRRKRLLGCVGYLTRGGENRRPILGKSAAEVEADHLHFVALHGRYLKLSACRLTPRWSGRVGNKVPSQINRVRAAQLHR
jgi:hypothetical protein